MLIWKYTWNSEILDAIRIFKQVNNPFYRMHTSEGGGICDCGDNEAFTRYFYLIFFFTFQEHYFLFEYFQSLSLLNSRRTGKKKKTIYFPKYFLDYFWKCSLKKSLLFNVKPNNSVLLHIFFLNLDWRGLKRPLINGF